MATIQLGVINDIGIIRIAPFTAVELKCLASAVNADNSAALADAATESANAAAATALSYVGTSPTGAYANLAALQAAYPTGEDGVFVVKDTGYWYFWNGSAWEDGGEYQKDIPTTTIEELRMSDLRQMSAIKEVENTLNSININQETTNTASGYGTISLPKNASNGGMEVKLEGLTAENLVVNGDFRNGTTGWTSVNVSELAAANGIASFTATARYGRIVRAYSAPIGSIMYMRARVKGSANIYVGTQSGARATRLKGTGSFEVISQRQEINTSSPSLTIQDGSTSGWSKVDVDFGFVINLTATFGAGNEPTVEQCDIIFSDYFDGVKRFVPTGRVRSVDKNGLNPTALYLTAPELRSNGTVKDEIRKGANGYELVKRVGIGTLGSELIINGGFVGGASEFSLLNGAVWQTGSGNGEVKLLREATGAPTIVQSGKSIASGTWLKYRFRVVSTSKPAHFIQISGVSSGNPMETADTISVTTTGWYERYYKATRSGTGLYLWLTGAAEGDEIVIDDFSVIPLTADGEPLSVPTTPTTIFGSNVHYTLATPEIIPISYGGVLNSAENGTVYHEPIIADAGVYGTNLPILMQDYPISAIEEIIKHENGVDTYLDVSTAVIAPDGLSITHPDLTDGDLVLFTYAYDKESTSGNITAIFYDSNVVKIDTATGTAYKIEDVVTNGVLTRTLTEV